MYNESNFTAPRPDCPRPEYWTSPDSESTESEVSEMIGGLIRGLQPDFVLETGTAYGFTSEYIGLALRRNGHGRLVTLEQDETRAEIAKIKLKNLPVTVLNQSSSTYTPEEPIDFAFFDSSFEGRIEEFKTYYHYMHRNTVVAFHDTGEQYLFRNNLPQFEEKGMLKLIYFPTARGIAIGQVLK